MLKQRRVRTGLRNLDKHLSIYKNDSLINCLNHLKIQCKNLINSIYIKRHFFFLVPQSIKTVDAISAAFWKSSTPFPREVEHSK